jgi:hypothetical protein
MSSQREFNWPVNSTVVNSGPIQFIKNGATTTVLQDTSTPANSVPMPVAQLNTSGVQIDPSTSTLQTTANTSLSSIDTKLTSQATAANQATGNTSLSSIDGKISTSNTSLSSIDTKLTAPLATKSPVNTNGSNTDSTVSTVVTLTAPANAVGFILMNLDTSSANIRWRIGATATASSGQQLQNGRDTGFVPCAANISICAESGTQNYNVQWILSA